MSEELGPPTGCDVTRAFTGAGCTGGDRGWALGTQLCHQNCLWSLSQGPGEEHGDERKRGHVPQSGERGNTHEHEKTGGKKGDYLGKSPWGGVGPEVIVSEGKGCLQEKGWLPPCAPR